MEKVISKLLGVEISKLEDCSGLNTAKEIIQQPDTWRESVKNLIKNKIEIKSFIDSFLSKKEFRIILTGAGTSAFAGEVCEPYLASLLNKRVEAIATTDLVASPKSYFIKDIPTLLVSFARSGNSPESVHAVNLATQLVDDLYQVVITCNENGKLAKNTVNDEKSLLLLMPPQTNDLGFAMTSSFTTMVLNAMAVFNINNIENFSSDVDKLSNSANDFIENNYEGLLEKTEYNTGIGKDIDKDTQDYYTFAIAYKKAVDYRVYVNNGENEKAEQVVKDIDNAQFNNVLFKEALENVKNIYISNGLSQ